MSDTSSSPTSTSVGQRISPSRSLIGGSSSSSSAPASPRGLLELVGAKHHRAHRRPQLRVDRLRGAAGAIDPQTQGRLGCRREVAAFDGRFLLGPASARLIGPLPARHARRDQDETLHELGSEHRQLECHPAAQRVADDSGRRVEQRLDIAHVRERRRLQLLLPEPPQIRCTAPDSRPREAPRPAAPTFGCPRSRHEAARRCSLRGANHALYTSRSYV